MSRLLQKCLRQVHTTLGRTASLEDLHHRSFPWTELGETRLSDSKGLSIARKFLRIREHLTKTPDQWRTLATMLWKSNQVVCRPPFVIFKYH